MKSPQVIVFTAVLLLATGCSIEISGSSRKDDGELSAQEIIKRGTTSAEKAKSSHLTVEVIFSGGEVNGASG